MSCNNKGFMPNYGQRYINNAPTNEDMDNNNMRMGGKGGTSAMMPHTGNGVGNGSVSPALPMPAPQGSVSDDMGSGQMGMMPPGMGPAATMTPPTVANPYFLAGYLQNYIGRKVRIEFLIGTSSITDRTGTLLSIGASYVVLQPVDSDDLMICDLYSIKFVTVIL